MEIYERIKELRKKTLKMSQTAFGNRLGVNRDTINNIELNRHKKPEQKLSLYKLICSEFNVSEEWLKTGEGEMYQQLSEDEEIAGIVSDLLEEGKDNAFYGIILEIAKTYNELSPASQKVLTEAAEKLADNLAKKKRD